MAKVEPVHRDLFKITALPLWVHDPATGRFLAVNDATTTTYQWSREELLETSIETLVPSAADRKTLDRVTPSTFVDGGTQDRGTEKGCLNGSPNRLGRLGIRRALATRVFRGWGHGRIDHGKADGDSNSDLYEP